MIFFYYDPPLAYLQEYAAEFDSDINAFKSKLEEFYNYISYRQKTNIKPHVENSLEDLEPLQLMTAQRSKGREFDTVIVMDSNENVWPHKKALSLSAIESERKVFYVATTRSMKRLYYIRSEVMGSNNVAKSRFLTEMGL